MNRSAAFAALRNRDAKARNATKAFMVRPLTKAGAVSKAPITAQDWQHNAFETAEAAEVRRAALELLNPGTKYTVAGL